MTVVHFEDEKTEAGRWDAPATGARRRTGQDRQEGLGNAYPTFVGTLEDAVRSERPRWCPHLKPAKSWWRSGPTNYGSCWQNIGCDTGDAK